MIRLGVALAGCAIATYYDLFNNRNVPNLLTYSMVILGVLFNVIDFSFENATMAFGPAILFFVFGYYFYINGQIGGADLLIFVAIALLLPQQPPSLIEYEITPIFTLPYVLSIFLISGILFSLYILATMLPKVIIGVLQGKAKLDKQRAALSLIIIIMYSFFLWHMKDLIPAAYVVIVAMIIVSAFFVYLFREFILDEYIIETVPLKEIEEEDVLAIERMDDKIVKKYELKKLLTASELERMSKLPIKKYPIYKNMPCFMPYILAAIIVTLITGDIFIFMVGQNII